MLATACGPAWLLARRPASRDWGAGGADRRVPALVYAYELFGSVKEITSLCMLLASDAWSSGTALAAAGRGAAVPFALVLAAGVSALGVAFAVWALIAVLISHSSWPGSSPPGASGPRRR